LDLEVQVQSSEMMGSNNHDDNQAIVSNSSLSKKRSRVRKPRNK